MNNYERLASGDATLSLSEAEELVSVGKAEKTTGDNGETIYSAVPEMQRAGSMRESIAAFVDKYAPPGFSKVEDGELFITLVCSRDIAPRAVVDYKRAKAFCIHFNRCYPWSGLAESAQQELITRICIAVKP